MIVRLPLLFNNNNSNNDKHNDNVDNNNNNTNNDTNSMIIGLGELARPSARRSTTPQSYKTSN